jgi:predicted metal-dependent hydrolase
VPENISMEEVRRFATISPISEYEHLVEARDLFNDEKYWGAHEALESVWKNRHHEERDLLNAIILIAAAFVHDQKDEYCICIAILSRAMEKLTQAK